MKKIYAILLLLVIVLSILGCSDGKSNSEEEIAIVGKVSPTIVESEKPTVTPTPMVNYYSEYNIFDFEIKNETKELTSIGSYKIDIKIKNNSDATISDMVVSVYFYDNEGVLIHTDNKMTLFTLEGGQAGIRDFWCPKDFATCKVGLYEYSIPEGFSMSSKYREVRINLIAEECEFWR